MASIETFIGSEGPIRWELNRRMRVLTLIGDGELPDYQPYEGTIPSWSYLREFIQEVRIKDGVTRIGDYAFFPYDYEMLGKRPPQLHRVVFPASLQSVGFSAFRGNVHLARIELTNLKALRAIEPYAFASCYRVRAIDLSGCRALQTIQLHAFAQCDALSYVDLTGCTSLSSKDIALLQEDVEDYVPIIGPNGSFLSGTNRPHATNRSAP